MKDEVKKVFGTKEWAQETFDCIRGCKHNCRYCYAKAEGARFKTRKPGQWPEEELMVTNKLAKLLRKQPTRIMFPAHHDISSMAMYPACWEAISAMLKAGHSLLIVSKPHDDVITALLKDLDAFPDAKDKVLFRFTIGSADNAVLKLWEPNAPSFEERIGCLKKASGMGYKTSVSCEPMLDNNVESVVSQCLPYINDALWLGLPNFMQTRLSLNGEEPSVKKAGHELTSGFTDERLKELHAKYGTNPKIKWKESLKERLGLKLPDEVGLDI